MDPPGNRHIVSCMRGSDNGMPTVISTDLKIAGNTEANERAARRGTADVMNGPPWEPPHCLMHARLRQWHANCNKYRSEDRGQHGSQRTCGSTRHCRRHEWTPLGTATLSHACEAQTMACQL